MKRNHKTLQTIFISILFLGSIASAHVPYFESEDFTEEQPFKVKKTILQSIAVYSWLEQNETMVTDDIDVYTFQVRYPGIRVYLGTVIPVCDGYYANFTPWFALVGPDLPDPGQPLPFDILEGYGAIVKQDVEPGENRTQFYEPFGGKYYYQGPEIDMNLNKTGTYYVYVWDPYETGGDYTLALGKYEFWGLLDIIRALIYTPLIRRDKELHLPDL